jgi:hypothetical protein
MYNGEMMMNYFFGKKGMSTEGVLIGLGLTIALILALIFILGDSSSAIKELIRSIFG